jgi:hypothetical protein
MTPKVWGPPVWIFLHTFSVNISEYGYSKVGMQFYAYLTRICRLLPCPDCAEHATKFINGVKVGLLRTKYDMANMLCTFHNHVNARKKLPLFNHSNLGYYENVSIVGAFNNFVKAFTIPSQRLMNETLQRKMLVSQLNKFMNANLGFFIKPPPPPPLPLPLPPPPTEPLKIETQNKFIEPSEPSVDIPTPNDISIIAEEVVIQSEDNITYEVSFIDKDEDSIPDSDSEVEM